MTREVALVYEENYRPEILANAPVDYTVSILTSEELKSN
jgi:hypothetical protein